MTSFRLKKRKEDRQTQPPPRADGSGVVAVTIDPMARPREMAAAISQLIGAAAELAGTSRVGYHITPLLSGVTVSWERRTLPSRQWLRDLEQEIITFGICNGLQIWFREH